MRRMVWFRTDLRVRDQPALSEACQRPDDEVIGLWLVTPGLWERHDAAGCRIEFLLRCVGALSQALARLKIPLLVRTVHRPADVPAGVVDAALAVGCEAIHFNREFGVDETRRDAAVVALARLKGVRVLECDDQCVFAPGEILTQAGTPYTVFTPFKKRWIERWREENGVAVREIPVARPPLRVAADPVPDSISGFGSSVPAAMWPGGEREAEARLAAFLNGSIGNYKTGRDRPDCAATSTLSPYLAAGVLSPRVAVISALAAKGEARGAGWAAKSMDRAGEGVSVWISELIWREFYRNILFHFPRVSMHRAFKPESERIPWLSDERLLAAWAEGRTGFPFVDAGMRQLAATGWMHNRLRMVTAMFLSKDLFLDWRLGERHFMRHLVDGDLAQNNGGWQWSASTGTDAAPYFRVFNPASQGERFDPEGAYVARWVPELRGLDPREIHDPAPLTRQSRGYPEPIVDHAKARQRVMAAFKAAV